MPGVSEPSGASAPGPATTATPATPQAPGPAPRGLSAVEAAERLRIDGPNALGSGGHRTRLRIAAAQFASPLVLLLVAASIVSLVVGDYAEASIILMIVVLSAALGFVQEARSEAAVAALQARLTLKAMVIRDGAPQEVPVHDVVRGDVVLLDAGDIVPADGRLLEGNHLYVDESSLTGESAPVLKDAGVAATATATATATGTARTPSTPGTQSPTASNQTGPGVVFFGTSVSSGSGAIEVTATGARTSYGEIARRLAERAPETDFQHGVRTFGLLIARVTILLVTGVFAINVALQRPLLESLLFAIALAVGLTPELLPAIVTLNLTRGARMLAAQGVLVKRLPAIQNLGSVAILCTDKTGTLTIGRLDLTRAVGIDSDDASEAASAVHLAWLNSHLQASFTNPLDAAILAGVPAPADADAHRKVAELPYDFSRRLLGVVLAEPDGSLRLVTKGAPESVIARSTAVREGADARPIGRAEHDRLAKLVDDASSQGFRLVAVGSRVLGPDELPARTAPDADALERDLVFEGVLLFSDPPKPGIGDTITELQHLGVALKVVTGDNDLVARHVAGEVGLVIDGVLTGEQIDALSDSALVARAARTTLFARVNPDQKLRVIRALRDGGAVVGYMGDGINDAPALHAADVGISVDNATDVARLAADIILLEPSLSAIAAGVREGRRTFANTLKYIRMGTSSNFGNMLSMAGAAFLLPFLPMTPGQILLNNLIYDASQTAIPTDDIDAEIEASPARWDIRGIERFMVVFGPISSIFDYLTFGLLLLILGANENTFHTGWFIESLFTQILVVLAIRTTRSPFWRSRPSRGLAIGITLALVAAVIIPLSPLGAFLGFAAPPLLFWPLLAVIVAAYLTLIEVVKRRFNPVSAR